MLDIVNLISYYIKRRIILDENSIRYIFEIIKNQFGLVDSNLKLNFEYVRNNYWVGNYNHNTKTIHLCLNEIINENSEYIIKNQRMRGFNNITYINFKILLILLHEFKHAELANSLIKREKNNYEINSHGNIIRITSPMKYNLFKVIKTSYVLKNKHFELYKEKHHSFPEEKDADMFAYEFAINVFEHITKDLVSDYEIKKLYEEFFKRITMGYNSKLFVDNPFKNIILSEEGKSDIQKIIRYEYLKKLIESQELNLYERLSYNFPITKEEDYNVRKRLEYAKTMPSRFRNYKGIILG